MKTEELKPRFTEILTLSDTCGNNAMKKMTCVAKIMGLVAEIADDDGHPSLPADFFNDFTDEQRGMIVFLATLGAAATLQQ